MDLSTAWWIGVGALLALEMITGTLYLLMLALGLAAAALAAHGGFSIASQITLGAVVGLLGMLAWRPLRNRQLCGDAANADRSVSLDIGEEFQIDSWSPQGQASVRYRGAQWSVVLRGEQPPTAGLHRVVELSGNRLIVEKI